MFAEIKIKSTKRQELLLLTEEIKKEIAALQVKNGLCFIFCPHTTAGLTINSYLDPATAKDLLDEVDRLVPTRTDFNHVFDTPSDAAGHIKSSLLGGQLGVIIEEGELVLGGAQGIFFWEYDGPRERKVYLKVLPS